LPINNGKALPLMNERWFRGFTYYWVVDQAEIGTLTKEGAEGKNSQSILSASRVVTPLWCLGPDRNEFVRRGP
jgi:hypothetical protein